MLTNYADAQEIVWEIVGDRYNFRKFAVERGHPTIETIQQLIHEYASIHKMHVFFQRITPFFSKNTFCKNTQAQIFKNLRTV